jgi:hypothetical protein
MADGARKDPALGMLWKQTPANFSSAPKAAQHRSAQKQVERSFLSVLGLHDPEDSAFHIEVFPL